MLRRNSSRNKHRRPLSRSESNSSMVQNSAYAFESIDPATAERHANIAALLSYHRAQGCPSSEMIVAPRDSASLFPDSSDATTSMARQSLERSTSVINRQGTTTSVRFAGLASHPRRTLALRASEGQHSPTKVTSQINAFGSTSTRPSSTMSFHAGRPAHYYLTRHYLESPQSPDVCCSPEEDASSMPFSFSKLRKSRSMLTSSWATTANAPSYSMPAKDHLPPTHSLYKATNNENEPPKTATPDAMGLRASASMTFPKSHQGMAASTPNSLAENDVVVRLARDMYREQMEEQERLQAQPFASTRSRNRHSEGYTGLRNQ
ncbi:hypothetical protein Neosp_004361 [[Neocosmospora] mangrovei]